MSFSKVLAERLSKLWEFCSNVVKTYQRLTLHLVVVLGPGQTSNFTGAESNANEVEQ